MYKFLVKMNDRLSYVIILLILTVCLEGLNMSFDEIVLVKIS